MQVVNRGIIDTAIPVFERASTANLEDGTSVAEHTPRFDGANYGMEFDRSGDYLFRAHDDSLAIYGDLTLELWIKPTNLALGTQTLIYKSYNCEYELIIYSTGYCVLFQGNGAFEAVSFSDMSSVIQEGIWNHLAIVRHSSGKQVYCYLNGVLVSSKHYAKTVIPSTNSIQIGRRPNEGGTFYFQGLMDEIRIWDVARTTDEIQDGMTKKITSAPGLVARYGFDEGQSDDGFVKETAEGINLFGANANFETGDTSDWTHSDANCAQIFEGDSVLGGTYCIELTSDGNNTDLIGKTIPVKAGQSYRLSYYQKSVAYATGFKLRVTWKDRNSATISTVESALVDSSAEWERRSVSITAPNDAAYAFVHFREGDSTGVFRVDNFQAQKGTVTTPWVSGAKEPFDATIFGGATYTSDNGFSAHCGKYITIERATTNLFSENESSIETSVPGTMHGAVNIASRSSDYAWHGNYSMRLVYHDTDEGEQGRYIDKPATPGSTYSLSFKALRTTGASGLTVKLIFRDIDTNTLATTTKAIGVEDLPLGEWADVYAISGTAPANTTTIRAVICYAEESVAGSTAYTDGLQLESGVPTSWILGGTSRGAEYLRIPTDGVLYLEEGQFDLLVDVTNISRMADYGRVFDVRRPGVSSSSLTLMRPNNGGGSFQLGVRTDDESSINLVSVADAEIPLGHRRFTVTWSSTSNKTLLYVDGTLKATLGYVPNAFSDELIVLGSLESGGRQLNTNISGFRVRNKAMTADEIAAEYEAGGPLPNDAWTTYLLDFDGDLRQDQGVTTPSRWRSRQSTGLLSSVSSASRGLVDTVSNSFTRDSVAYNEDGTEVAVNEPRYGRSNYGMSFDGVNDVISVPNPGVELLSSFTIEAWIKLNSLTGTKGIWYDRQAIDANRVLVSGNDILVQMRTGGAYRVVTASDALASPNVWYHVVVSYSGTSFKIFVNGEEKVETASTGVLTHSSNHWWIGRGTTASALYYFEGLMDEVRIWNVDKSEDIAYLMANKITEAPGLIARYGFDEGAPASVSLLTENQENGGEDGTTTGFTQYGGNTTLSSSTAQAHQGSRSILFTCPSSQGGGRGFKTDIKPVIPGQDYYFSVYVYRGLASTAGWFVLHWTDAAGADISFTGGAAVADVPVGEWGFLSDTRTAPSNAAGVYLDFIRASGTQSQLYTDSIQLLVGNGAGVVLDTAAPINLLTLNQSNGGENGTASGFNRISQFYGESGDTIGVDTEEKHQGQYSIKVTTDGVNIRRGVRSLLGNIVPGQTYIISGWVKGHEDAIGSSVGVVLYSDYNTAALDTDSIELTGDWQEFELVGAVPNGDNFLDLWLRSSSAITFWVDGLQIQKGSTATPWVPGEKDALNGVIVGASYTTDNPFGSYGDAIGIHDGGENVLTATQSSFEDGTTGASGFGAASVTRSSLWSWHGDYSLMVVGADGGDNHVRITDISYTTDVSYAVSARIYNPNSTSITVSMGLGSTTNVSELTVPPGEEGTIERVYVISVTSGASTIRFFEATGKTFFIDGVQKLDGASRTLPWTLGGTTSSKDLFYIRNSGILDPNNFCIAGSFVAGIDSGKVSAFAPLVNLGGNLTGVYVQSSSIRQAWENGLVGDITGVTFSAGDYVLFYWTKLGSDFALYLSVNGGELNRWTGTRNVAKSVYYIYLYSSASAYVLNGWFDQYRIGLWMSEDDINAEFASGGPMQVNRQTTYFLDFDKNLDHQQGITTVSRWRGRNTLTL